MITMVSIRISALDESMKCVRGKELRVTAEHLLMNTGTAAKLASKVLETVRDLVRKEKE